MAHDRDNGRIVYEQKYEKKQDHHSRNYSIALQHTLYRLQEVRVRHVGEHAQTDDSHSGERG